MTGRARAERPLDVVELTGLEVRSVVGVYPHERTRTQPLVVGLALHVDLRAAGASDDVTDTVDYGRVTGEVRFLLERARFRLIESAAETIARWLLLPPSVDAPRPALARVVVRIDKPEALRGLARPSVIITRDASTTAAPASAHGGVAIESLHRGHDVAVARVRLAPGARIAPHRHETGEEHELTMSDGLCAVGQSLPWGMAVRWSTAQPHQWHNPTGLERSLLRVTLPPSADAPAPPAETTSLLAPTDYAPAGTRT